MESFQYDTLVLWQNIYFITRRSTVQLHGGYMSLCQLKTPFYSEFVLTAKGVIDIKFKKKIKSKRNKLETKINKNTTNY